MLHSQIQSSPAKIKRPISNLSLAIDKAIVRKIASLSDQIGTIEFQSDKADRVKFLKSEILNLEDQLSDVRRLAL